MFFSSTPFKKQEGADGRIRGEAPAKKEYHDEIMEAELKQDKASQAPALDRTTYEEYRRAHQSDELPCEKEEVDKRRNNRNVYLEAREAVELEQKELKAVHAEIGRELREMCRPEIDDYIDCTVGRIWTVMQCKRESFLMRRCLKKAETPEFVEKRTMELLKEREESGESLVNNASGANRERRALYNRAILPKVEENDVKDIMIKKPKKVQSE
eukprot:TRINITY_DN44745_c0_g1_i4.p1 TRINITY_DN44745_c0_g1~~TRINITY_DN44745_c0_g1_i4.p1  ORF type:complete len:213 (-),score=70.24 TRINITY_DN44745_c0_g1_i4:201-839(-)